MAVGGMTLRDTRTKQREYESDEGTEGGEEKMGLKKRGQKRNRNGRRSKQRQQDMQRKIGKGE